MCNAQRYVVYSPITKQRWLIVTIPLQILLYQLIYLFILKHEGRENSLYYVLQNLVENATPFKFQKISFAPVADAVAPPYRSQTI